MCTHRHAGDKGGGKKPVRRGRTLPKALIAMQPPLPPDVGAAPPPLPLGDAEADPASFKPSPFLNDIISLVDDQAQAWPWLFEPDEASVEEGEDEAKSALVDAHERREKAALQRRMARESERLLKHHKQRAATNEKYKAMQAQRRRLPAYQMADRILAAINSAQVVVVSGETGALHHPCPR